MIPKKYVDTEKLDKLLEYGAQLEECAHILGVSDSTIYRFLKNNFNLTFEEYREQKFSLTLQKLRRKQFAVAMGGDKTMLIWLGKQYLGQQDTRQIEQKTLSLNMSAADMAKQVPNMSVPELEAKIRELDVRIKQRMIELGEDKETIDISDETPKEDNVSQETKDSDL